MSNTCPSQFAAAVKSAGDQFDDILTNDELLNLTDPTKALDEGALSEATAKINAKTQAQRVVSKPAIVTGKDFQDLYPKLNERIAVGELSEAEIAIFATETGAAFDDDDAEPGQVSLDMDDWTPGAQIPAPVDQTLALLNNFLDDNIGKSLSSGQCAAFAVKVAVVGGLLQSLKAKADSLDGLPGFDLPGIPSIDDLLEQAKSKLALESIQKSLKGAVDGVMEKVSKAGDSIIAGIEDFDASIKDAVNKVQAFTSDKNKNGMMDGIDKMVANIGSGFEKLDAKSLGLLMFRLCQVSEAIQASGEKPLQDLILVASGVNATKKTAKDISARATRDAVNAGATRMDPNDVEAKKKEYEEKQRAVSSDLWDLVEALKVQFGENKDGIGMNNEYFAAGDDELTINVYKKYPKVSRIKQLPKDQQAHVKVLSTKASATEGAGPIKWVPGSRIATTQTDKNGRDTGAPGPGWTNVDTKIWVQLMDMANQLGHDIEVKAGYWNESKGKLFKKGKAIIIVYPPTVDAVISHLIAASRAGFKFIIAGKDMMMLSNKKRYGAIDQELSDLADEAVKGTPPNSQERIDALNSVYSPIVLYALMKHLRDHWVMYQAVTSANSNAPDPAPTPDEQAKQDQQNSSAETSVANV